MIAVINARNFELMNDRVAWYRTVFSAKAACSSWPSTIVPFVSVENLEGGAPSVHVSFPVHADIVHSALMNRHALFLAACDAPAKCVFRSWLIA